MEFLFDLFKFLMARKKWWLAPVIFVLLLLGVLLIAGGNSIVGPFIYTIF